MALSTETIIQTPSGPRSIIEIEIGDLIYNSNGKTVSIICLIKNKEKIYQINLLDKSIIIASGDHKFEARKRENKYTKFYSTLDLIKQDVLKLSKGRSKGFRSNFSIPLSSSVNFYNSKILKIDPYIIGLLLGDGGLNSREANLAIENKDADEIQSNIECRLFEGIRLSVNQGKGCKRFKFINEQEFFTEYHWKLNPFYAEIKNIAMDVAGKDKRIPNIYKYSSEEDRIDLIRGLMDSDGSCSNGHASFTNISEFLVDDLKFVIESLGGKAVKRINKRLTSSGNNSYVLTVQTNFNPFMLFRKANKYDQKISLGMKRNIIGINDIGIGETISIKTNEESNTILINNFIKTMGE